MAHYKGRIAEVLLESYQNAVARLSCPPESLPRPGQYLQAHCPDEHLEVIPTSLFAAGNAENLSATETTLPIAASIPNSWQPGTELLLRGPLGRGFEIPRRTQRMALLALDRNPGRLLPLVSLGLQRGVKITLLRNETGGELPLAVEEQSLDELPSVTKWADYLAVDISIEQLDGLETIFEKQIPLAPDAESLVAAPMPCGGMAKCGICMVRTKQGPRLACEDGPVFKLKELI